MPLSPQVAVDIANLLNTENQLAVQYTAEMILRHQERYVFRSSENSELMGAVEAKRVQWYQCDIDHLSVHPNFRRQGVGEWLLKAAEELAVELGARITQCTIRVGNTASEGLFRKNGYSPTTTFSNEQTGNRVTVYQKRLDALDTPVGTSIDACRVKIIRDYARWTVLSALRSGAPVKSRKIVYSTLRTVDFEVILQETTMPITIEQFDEWHEGSTVTLCERYPNLSIGWAAKMVNVYLKTAVYIGGLGRSGLVAAVHPPIDSGLWSGLRRRFRGHALLNKTHVVERIKDIRDYETYRTIVSGCRLAAEQLKCLPIEVEQLWEGADL